MQRKQHCKWCLFGLFLKMQGTLNSLELGLGKIIKCDNQR